MSDSSLSPPPPAALVQPITLPKYIALHPTGLYSTEGVHLHRYEKDYNYLWLVDLLKCRGYPHYPLSTIADEEFASVVNSMVRKKLQFPSSEVKVPTQESQISSIWSFCDGPHQYLLYKAFAIDPVIRAKNIDIVLGAFAATLIKKAIENPNEYKFIIDQAHLLNSLAELKVQVPLASTSITTISPAQQQPHKQRHPKSKGKGYSSHNVHPASIPSSFDNPRLSELAAPAAGSVKFRK